MLTSAACNWSPLPKLLQQAPFWAPQQEGTGHEILKYYQSTSRLGVNVLQNLVVLWLVGGGKGTINSDTDPLVWRLELG